MAYGEPNSDKPWTFLTNHARVLIHVARSPRIRVRDIAAGIGITERATQIIVSDLEEGGYVTRARHGRRTHYTLHPGQPFRHPAEADHTIRALIELFVHIDDQGMAEGSPEAESAAVLRQEPPDKPGRTS